MSKNQNGLSQWDVFGSEDDESSNIIDFMSNNIKKENVNPENGGHYFLGGTFDNQDSHTLIQSIEKAEWKSIHVQNTHPTPYSETISNIKKDPKLRPRVRTISVAWPDDNGFIQTQVWDLDKMDQVSITSLVLALLNKTLIAHDAIKQIGWLWNILDDYGQFKPYPEYVQCTRLLAKTQLPMIDRMIRSEALSNVSLQQFIKKDNNKELWTKYELNELGFILNLPNHHDIQPKININDFKNTAILAPMHYRHCVQSSLEPLMLMYRLLYASKCDFSGDLNEVLNRISDFMKLRWKESKKLNFYREVSMPATKHFMKITNKGVPFNLSTAMYYKQRESDKLMELVNSINEFNYPELVPFKDILKVPNKGVTETMQEAFVKTFLQYDPTIQFTIGNGGSPLLGAKDLRAIRVHKGPAKEVYDLLVGIQSAKQGFKTAQSFIDYGYRAANRFKTENVVDRNIVRLHPSFGFNTNTDRMSTEEPTTQNWKNDGLFRSMIHAKEDHVIVSADYSQIELRNAAALALRSQQHIRDILNNPEHTEPTKIGNEAVAIIRQIFAINDVEKLSKGIDIYEEQDKLWTSVLDLKLESFNNKKLNVPKSLFIPSLNKTLNVPQEYQDLKDLRDIVRLKKYAAIIRKIQIEQSCQDVSMMAEAFRKNIDVHLLTALTFAIKNGKFTIPDGVSLLDYLEQAPSNVIKQLKEQFEKERRGAKATNFGLLYGMRTSTLHNQGLVIYGLDWEIEEARDAEHIWFNLFPEIGLYQYFSILTPAWEGPIVITKYNQIKQKTQRYWKCVSLYGREYEVDDFRKALNYQNQGTGAHTIQKAMALMPEYLSDCLINQIHDESVAEVPKSLQQQAEIDKRKAMIQAAEEVLSPYNIPVLVDIEVNEVWVHGEKPDQIPQEFLDELTL